MTTRPRPTPRTVELRLADTVVDVDFELTRQLCRDGVPTELDARCRALDAFRYAAELTSTDIDDDLVYVAAVAIQWAAAIRRRPAPAAELELAPPDPRQRVDGTGRTAWGIYIATPPNYGYRPAVDFLGRPCSFAAWEPEATS